ncbi:MAG: S9 family peptidase [Planctomycetota bacterium]
MPNRAHTPLVCLLLVACPSVSGQTPVRAHDITADDYFSLSWISHCVMAPDGRRVAYVERRWDEELDGRNADLWVVSTEGTDGTHPRRRLTFDHAADLSPSWSPDGRWIYFTSARKQGDDAKPPYNDKTQVWRISVDGGNIIPVTRQPEGILGYELSVDGRSLYFTAGVKTVEADAWKPLRETHDDLDYGHGVVTFSQLWKLDLESWRQEKLVDEKRVIVTFRVAPDERRVAMVTRPDNTLLSNEGWSTIDVYDTASGSVTALPDTQWRDEAPSPFGWIVEPCWSSDSAAFAFRVDFDGYPAEIFVARFDAAHGIDISKVERPGEVSAEGRMRWRPGTGDLCFIAEDRARARVYCVKGVAAGRPRGTDALTPGDVVVEAFSFDRDGRRMALVMSGLDHPPDVFVKRAGDGPVRITEANPQVDTWRLPSIQIVKWVSPDGTPVEGILELPPDHAPGRPLPMVVEIHGGPTASTKYRFRYWIYGRTLFAARGWALLSPNYRGSTGYGDAFLTDLIGNKNNLDVQDILAGVDAMIERGVADPERLAVMGWSNGGYLTNCLITRDHRFKAASSGAGVIDTVMQWGIEDTPGHVINYSRGLPWEEAAKMHETSPLYDVHLVETPTLIHVGEKDARVPLQHSRALHRALHHYLGVPCELVIYPGAGHGLTKLTHRKAKLAWDVAWFDTHVLGKSASADQEQ